MGFDSAVAAGIGVRSYTAMHDCAQPGEQCQQNFTNTSPCLGCHQQQLFNNNVAIPDMQGQKVEWEQGHRQMKAGEMQAVVERQARLVDRQTSGAGSDRTAATCHHSKFL